VPEVGGGAQVKTSDALQAARARIEDPVHWKIGAGFDGGGACCSVTALVECWPYHYGTGVVAAVTLDSAAVVICGDRSEGSELRPAAWVNDYMGHAAALEMFDIDIAISMALSDEAAE